MAFNDQHISLLYILKEEKYQVYLYEIYISYKFYKFYESKSYETKSSNDPSFQYKISYNIAFSKYPII